MVLGEVVFSFALLSSDFSLFELLFQKYSSLFSANKSKTKMLSSETHFHHEFFFHYFQKKVNLKSRDLQTYEQSTLSQSPYLFRNDSAFTPNKLISKYKPDGGGFAVIGGGFESGFVVGSGGTGVSGAGGCGVF